MNIIEQIHSEVDTAVDRLLDISLEYSKLGKEKKEFQKIDILESLENLGFNNPDIVKYNKNKIETKQFNTQRSELNGISRKIQEDVEKYQKIFPFHKYILYTQMIEICEKYNLVIGKVYHYKGEIPEKNSLEIIKFPYKNFNCYLSIANEGIFSAINNTSGYQLPYLHICAPRIEFDKDLTQIGREVIKGDFQKKSFKEYIQSLKKIKDPIVLLPVPSSIPNQIGFIVVSKWGLEANDPALQVGINN